MQRGIAVSIGPFEVGFLSQEELNDLGPAVESGTGERSHAILRVAGVEWGTAIDDSFDLTKVRTLDGSFELIAKLSFIDSVGLGDVFFFFGDVEDKVIAEETFGVLNLKEMDSIWRRVSRVMVMFSLSPWVILAGTRRPSITT